MDVQVRRIWPPRLVEVFDHGIWRTAQIEAWRFGPAGRHMLIRYVSRTPRPKERPPVWVVASRVRPRGDADHP
jgi:hypothetical protein